VTADVVVVGGGIVGAAAAAFLAEAGAGVTLFEATAIAAGASGRNSGIVQQPFDPALVGLYRRSLELYRELAADVPDGFHLDDEPSGLLYIGPEEAADAARELVTAWAATYPEAVPEMVLGPAIAALEPGLADGLAACRLRIGYPATPASATRAYARRAERSGARIVVAEAALAVAGDAAVGVLVDGRLVAADAVIVAAGPWTPAVAGAASASLPIGRSWGLVAGIALDRPPRHVLEEIDIDIEPEDGRDHDDPVPDEGIGFSLVTADGASALGSTFLPRPPAEAATVGRLRERGARYVPAIASTAVTTTRLCARPVTPDGRPLIGPIPGVRRAFVAAGHGPWGISTGPATAEMAADLVLRRRTDVPPPLASGRFAGSGSPRQESRSR
jgi:glycine/D-amino acid oxidase-like deaminating enzyme